jgi:hypothetical protein
MKRFILLTVLAAGLAGVALTGSASAWETGRLRAAPAPANCWHGPYYHTGWGMPVALIVPPTAERQTHWGWGIGNTRVTPIGAQYQLGYPVAGPFGPAPLYPTPAWPSDLDQFGVYYIRGPW